MSDYNLHNVILCGSMQNYSQFYSQEKTSLKFELKYKDFFKRKCISNCYKMDAISFGFPHVRKPGLILGLHPANERCRYKVTPSLIGWVQT